MIKRLHDTLDLARSLVEKVTVFVCLASFSSAFSHLATSLSWRLVSRFVDRRCRLGQPCSKSLARKDDSAPSDGAYDSSEAVERLAPASASPTCRCQILGGAREIPPTGSESPGKQDGGLMLVQCRHIETSCSHRSRDRQYHQQQRQQQRHQGNQSPTSLIVYSETNV